MHAFDIDSSCKSGEYYGWCPIIFSFSIIDKRRTGPYLRWSIYLYNVTLQESRSKMTMMMMMLMMIFLGICDNRRLVVVTMIVIVVMMRKRRRMEEEVDISGDL